MALPASTAAKAPGSPHGSRRPPDQRRQDEHEGDQADERVGEDLQRGQECDEQDRDARDRPEQRGARDDPAHPVAGEGEDELRAPPSPTVTPIPIFQARIGSRVSSIAGPSTPNTMPKSDGVSMPKGIAVTSVRPVVRINRSASHV